MGMEVRGTGKPGESPEQGPGSAVSWDPHLRTWQKSLDFLFETRPFSVCIPEVSVGTYPGSCNRGVAVHVRLGSHGGPQGSIEGLS